MLSLTFLSESLKIVSGISVCLKPAALLVLSNTKCAGTDISPHSVLEVSAAKD